MFVALADLMLGVRVTASSGVKGAVQVSSNIHNHLWGCYHAWEVASACAALLLNFNYAGCRSAVVMRIVSTVLVVVDEGLMHLLHHMALFCYACSSSMLAICKDA